MAENLTKFPKGLISLLGLRDYGSTPRTLEGQIKPVVDRTQLYLLNDRELFNLSAIAAPAVGSNTFGGGTPDTVPAGELWYVWGFSISIGIAVATAITFKPVVSYDNNNYFFALNNYEAGAASEQLRIASAQPFWASGGTIFGAHVRSITGAPGTLDGRLSITRLRV